MFHLPVKQDIDLALVAGAAIFGGWLGHERTLLRAGDRLLSAWTRAFLRLRRDDACRNPHP